MKKPKTPSKSDYDVGYGKPPESSRFPKGKSGNPAGRPKKIKGLKELMDEELQQMIRADGKSAPMSRVLVQSLFRNAIRGKPAAMNIVFAHLAGHDPQVDEEDFEPETDDKIALRRWLAQMSAAQKEGNND